MVVHQIERRQPGQVRRQGKTVELTGFNGERAQIRQAARNGALAERVGTEIEHTQVRQRIREGKAGESVIVKVKQGQIAGGFQTFDALYIPVGGVQVGQAEHVRHGQWAHSFLQRSSNSGVQASVGNGHRLRLGRRRHQKAHRNNDPDKTENSSYAS